MLARRKLFAVILALMMLLSMAGTVCAAENEEATACIQKMINYYRYHQDAAATDIECLLYELSQIDPAKAEIWRSIMEYWHSANTDMTYYDGVIPEGLPQDDTLCIVVMGYALSSDGSRPRWHLPKNIPMPILSAPAAVPQRRKKAPQKPVKCQNG